MLGTPEQERITQEDRPSPQQIAQLASASLLFAQRHDKLRIERQEGGKRFMALPMSYHERPDILSGAPFGTLHRHMLGAIAIHRDDDSWSMRMFKVFEAINLGSLQGAVREVFSFDWNQQEVTRSRRMFRVVPAPEDRDIYDLIENFSVSDTPSAALELHDEFVYVTAGDATELARDAATLREGVDCGERLYVEPRRNYMDYIAK